MVTSRLVAFREELAEEESAGEELTEKARGELAEEGTSRRRLVDIAEGFELLHILCVETRRRKLIRRLQPCTHLG